MRNKKQISWILYGSLTMTKNNAHLISWNPLVKDHRAAALRKYALSHRQTSESSMTVGISQLLLNIHLLVIKSSGKLNLIASITTITFQSSLKAYGKHNTLMRFWHVKVFTTYWNKVKIVFFLLFRNWSFLYTKHLKPGTLESFVLFLTLYNSW